jgi:hypothetical protein
VDIFPDAPPLSDSGQHFADNFRTDAKCLALSEDRRIRDTVRIDSSRHKIGTAGDSLNLSGTLLRTRAAHRVIPEPRSQVEYISPNTAPFSSQFCHFYRHYFVP